MAKGEDKLRFGGKKIETLGNPVIDLAVKNLSEFENWENHPAIASKNKNVSAKAFSLLNIVGNIARGIKLSITRPKGGLIEFYGENTENVLIDGSVALSATYIQSLLNGVETVVGREVELAIYPEDGRIYDLKSLKKRVPTIMIARYRSSVIENLGGFTGLVSTDTLSVVDVKDEFVLKEKEEVGDLTNHANMLLRMGSSVVKRRYFNRTVTTTHNSVDVFPK